MTDPTADYVNYDAAIAGAVARAAQPGCNPELHDLIRAAQQMRAELDELNNLFELQWERSREASARWRAEDPEKRALTTPDLGELLKWLMAQADQAAAGKPA